MSDNHFTEIPFPVFRLHGLTVLKLRGNKIKKITNGIDIFKSLVELDLADNELETLPTHFKDLTQLKSLYLSNNVFVSLPDELNALTRLEILDCAENKNLSSVPHMKNVPLKKLNLSSVRLNELPDFCWSQLVEFKSQHNQQIYELPESIGILQTLESLTLSFMSLTTLPISFQELYNVKYLDLSHNHLIDECLPLIASLKKVTRLKLNVNELSFIDAAVFQLRSLIELDLSSNHIDHIDASLNTMKKLQYLNLSENQLDALPLLGEMESLQTLEVRNNRLEQLPFDLGSVLNLQKLDISHNALHTLPASIVHLKSLVMIEMKDNPWMGSFHSLIGKSGQQVIDAMKGIGKNKSRGSAEWDVKVVNIQ